MKVKAITRMEGRSKPISSVICQVYRFLLGMELPDCKNGSKNLQDKVSFEETRIKPQCDTSSFTWQETADSVVVFSYTYVLDVLSSCQGECQ